MTGNNVKIYAGNEMLAAATEASIEFVQEAIPVEAIPGTLPDEEAAWQQFRPGNLSWSIKHKGFVTDVSLDYIRIVGDRVTVMAEIGDLDIDGKAQINEASIVASVNSLAKISLNMEGNDFPNIELYERDNED